MKPQEVLTRWANVCDQLGIKWYMYQETLLCANGYHSFPNELKNVQIAVRAKDLPDIIKMVIPRLPKGWHVDKQQFARKTGVLQLKNKKDPIINITILHGVDNQGDVDELSKKVKNFRRISPIMRVVDSLAWRLNHVFRKPFVKIRDRSIDRTFAKLVDLAGRSIDKKAYYCDIFTNKQNPMLSRDLFSDTMMIHVSETQNVTNEDFDFSSSANIEASFPTFSGYRRYLENVYGDYENGLFDGIGVGLTLDEKKALRQHQEKCIEALTFLQNLSKRHGLRYCLIAGSVLGAVRHAGFIPWDDDVDIGVRVEDLETFERIVKENLPQHFTLEQSGANNPYPRMFSKICYKGRCCIDIWPLVPTYLDGMKALFQWYFGKIITKAHYGKIGHEVTKYNKLVKVIDAFLSDKAIMNMARKNERKYMNKDTPAYINLYSIYKREKEAISRRWLDDEATATFSGIEVPVVGCTKVYLTHLYGNFMSYPAPWKRASRHVARF